MKAAVEAAAVALLCGWQPMRWAYTDVPGEWRPFADQVLTRANQLRVEEWDALVKAVAGHVGNRVGEIMAKAFG